MKNLAKLKKQDIKFAVMAVVLVLLIVLVGIQTMELNSLTEKVNVIRAESEALGSIQSTVTIKGSGSSTLKSNLDNLPTMVGGC